VKHSLHCSVMMLSWLAAMPVVAAAPASRPAANSTNSPPATKAEILAVMEKMADAQLAVADRSGQSYRDRAPADWVAGAFYVGLARLSHVSASPRFLEAEKAIAENNTWEFKTNNDARHIAMADNETIGQMYIDLAATEKDPAKLDRCRRQWDDILAGFDDPANVRNWNGDLARDGKAIPWWWCDAFFMAPPGLTRLSQVIGDRKYIDTMDKQWWITYDKLYDQGEHLFFRDAKYMTQKSSNGKKVFWSRGNGWVVAGTANVLTYMPKDYPTRAKYEKLFQEMTAKLATIQQPDGLWRMSLVDPESSPFPETSGTGFFCYAFAWGINNSLLERAKFEPIIDKAWAALNTHILPSGLIGAVQPIGEQPVGASSNANTSQPYAVGAFLLAGCELITLHGDK
jgi:unsaturated rhamnogalacturonyl hydrolase